MRWDRWMRGKTMLNGHRLADIQHAEDSLLSVHGPPVASVGLISCGYRKNTYTSTISTTLATTVTIVCWGE